MTKINRNPIFKAVRPWLDGGFSKAQIAALDAAIDAALSSDAPLTQRIADNPDRFQLRDDAAFWEIVRRLFNSRLSNAQTAGIAAIMAAAAHHPAAWLAYELATAFHETGAKMSPNRENMNYSVKGLRATFGAHRISAALAARYGRAKGRPADQQAIANIVYGGQFGREQLGNTAPGDGWKYRGGGMCHNTGKRNAKKADHDMGLGGKYVENPDIILDIDIAAREMVTGMEMGRYTGRNLARYLSSPIENSDAFTAARRIINGTDRAYDVAQYALVFQSALIAGRWS